MQLIEDSPERLVYRRHYDRNDNVWTMLTKEDVPQLFVMTFIVIAILSALLKPSSNVWEIIISGILIVGYIFAVWWIQREVRGRQLTESTVIVDKQTRQLTYESEYRSGKNFHITLVHEQILRLEPTTSDYQPALGYYGIQIRVSDTFSYGLPQFDNHEARDAMLLKLQAALELPLEVLA